MSEHTPKCLKACNPVIKFVAYCCLTAQRFLIKLLSIHLCIIIIAMIELINLIPLQSGNVKNGVTIPFQMWPKLVIVFMKHFSTNCMLVANGDTLFYQNDSSKN